MSDNTSIQWTDASWNPLRARDPETDRTGWSCVKVSPGCQHCYAGDGVNKRFGTGLDYTVGDNARVEHYLDDAPRARGYSTLEQPLHCMIAVASAPPHLKTRAYTIYERFVAAVESRYPLASQRVAEHLRSPDGGDA